MGRTHAALLSGRQVPNIEMRETVQEIRCLGEGIESALDLSKEQVALCVTQAWAVLIRTGGYASEVRSQFKLIGADLALDESKDNYLDPRLRSLWEDVRGLFHTALDTAVYGVLVPSGPAKARHGAAFHRNGQPIPLGVANSR